MSQELYILLLIAVLIAQNVAEAWLEDIVIKIKDPRYATSRLNEVEHRRSMVWAMVATVPYLAAVIWAGFYWLIGFIVINRRLVFDTALKLYRKRPLRVYERKRGIDGFMARILGTNGALTEIALEAAASAGFVILHLL